MSVRVGTSLRSGYAVDDPREGARWMVERTKAAWDAGLDSLFVGDHHGVPAAYYQNSPILGRLLAEWGDRPAGALYLLPLWDPVLVAEQVATLAAVARGRFVMQCAIGAGAGQFAAMGASLRTRPSRFEEHLAAIRTLLAGEAVERGGQPVRIGPLPAEPVEVWIGGHAPAAIDRAARLGDGWLAGPDLTTDDARRLLVVYRQRCEEHGREPSVVAIRRDVHVGADDADAERVAGPVLARGYRGFDPSAVVYGGPERVAERFRELGEMGYSDVIVRHLADDQQPVLDSIARLQLVREALA